ncbi:ABC transporter permease [uncultured Paludibaculum sp.]|uniref:ABC transporter permease n=1 Tax=uncultured Paludibaculum sp. TaxID=1765020 RepID=UPI002AAAD3C0|nr:ABC transporter permease [uncultured Paludibaculum sp.]
MPNLLPDIRFALRSLLRSRGFAVASVACLALGIGATTSIFSVVNAVLLRPLSYKNPEGLARIYTEFPRFPNGGLRRFWTSGPEFLELRRDLRSWQSIDAWRLGGVNLSGSTEPLRIMAGFVSGGLMETLGVQPRLGRLLTKSDDVPGANPAVVLSAGLWNRAFGSDPNILRREVWLDGRKANVIGVMPEGFQYPPGETEPAEMWSAMQLDPARPGGRGGHGFNLLGRLKPGVTLEQARQEAAQYVRATGEKERANPNLHMLDPEGHPLVMYGLQQEVTGSVRPALLAMFAAVGFVLLIACGNVANLLLARAESRQREIAVRRAMGASTMGLIRQFVVEGILLSLGGAVAGLALAFGCLRLILSAAGASLPRATEIGLDTTVLAFTIGISIFTGIFFGFAPLAQSLPRSLAETLKAAGGRTTATREAHILRRLMITSEIALALVLLIGAGLMMSAFWKLQAVRSGIQPDNVMTMRMALPREVYRQPADILSFWARLEQRTRTLPGVVNASLVGGLPPIRPVNANDTQIEGFVQKQGGPIQNIDYWNSVGANYFATMGIQLLDGRFFNESDGASSQPVLIINETLARIYYPGQSPIGKRMRPDSDDPWRTIVGVVADVKNAGLDKPAGTELYFPMAQTEGNFRSSYLVARTQGDPMQLVSALRATIRELDPALPVSGVMPMTEVMAKAQARPRFLALLIALFSAVALGLAALGIYSVMAYSVAQRTNEFGIRMAMGAVQGDVLRLVLRQGLILGVVGVAAGAAGALALNRLLRGSLYGVGAFDPWPFVGMSALLLAVTALACLAPALRATRVDPVIALRYE